MIHLFSAYVKDMQVTNPVITNGHRIAYDTQAREIASWLK